jgi:hypothetical protein
MLEIRTQHTNKKLPHRLDNSVKSYAVHRKQVSTWCYVCIPLNKRVDVKDILRYLLQTIHRSVLLLPVDMFANFTFKLHNLQTALLLTLISLQALMI